MASTARSRARISRSSGMDVSGASPDFSIRSRKAPDAWQCDCPGHPGQACSPLAERASTRIAQPEATKQSRANPRADAAMKLLLPGAPNPEQVTPRGALRSMPLERLHLGFSPENCRATRADIQNLFSTLGPHPHPRYKVTLTATPAHLSQPAKRRT